MRYYIKNGSIALAVGWLVTCLVYKYGSLRSNATGKADHSQMTNDKSGTNAFLKEQLVAKRSLHVLNAPKLMMKMDRPRKRYQFVMEPTKVDKSNKEVMENRWTSIVIVKSGLTNQARRDAIRDTWGNTRHFKGSRLETVFIVGRPTKSIDDAYKNINKEQELHGDILMLDQPDTAENVPHKTLAGMQWVADSVPPTWIYSSSDDDISLHVRNYAQYIDKLIEDNNWKELHHEANLKSLPIICMYSYKAADLPARNPKSKWYISRETYPRNAWPPYCRGGWYSMSVKLASELYDISRWMPYLYLDDVWITGLMRVKRLSEDCPYYDYILNGRLDIAPLANRTDKELAGNLKEDSSKIVVSHAWGNIDGRNVDVPSTIRDTFRKWSISHK